MAPSRPKPLTSTQWEALAYCAKYAPHPRNVHTDFWGSAKGSEGLRHDTLAVLQLRGLIDTETSKPRVTQGRDSGSYWQASTTAQVTPKGMALLATRRAKPNARRPAPGQAALPGFGAPMAPAPFPVVAHRAQAPSEARTWGIASAAGFLTPPVVAHEPSPEPVFEPVPFVEPLPSAEDIAETLFMVIENTGDIYRGPRDKAEARLARLYHDGQYRREAAPAAYAATIQAGVEELRRELHGDPDAPRLPITPEVRRLVAEDLVRHFEVNGFGQHRLRPAVVPVRAPAPRPAPSPRPAPAPRAPTVAAHQAAQATALSKTRTLLDRAEKLLAEAEKGAASRERANTPRRQAQALAMVKRAYTEAATAAQRVLDAVRKHSGAEPGEAVDAWGRMANKAAAILATAKARASGDATQAVWKAETSTAGADYFPTPPALAHEMVAIADVRQGKWALEPSAGMGVIVAELLKHTGKVMLVEADPHRAAYLRREYQLQAYFMGEDFLTFQPPHAPDAIVMNPPFTSPGDPVAYVAHVEHALGMLGKGGSLVALVPSTFGPDHRNARVRALYQHLVARLAEIEPVPRGHRFGTTAIPVTMIRVGRALRSHEYPLSPPAAPQETGPTRACRAAAPNARPPRRRPASRPPRSATP
jgi:phospholipid N-methyltransferase